MEYGLGLTQPINDHFNQYRYQAWSLSYLLVASSVYSSITHLAHGQALLLANQEITFSWLFRERIWKKST